MEGGGKKWHVSPQLDYYQLLFNQLSTAQFLHLQKEKTCVQTGEQTLTGKQTVYRLDANMLDALLLPMNSVKTLKKKLAI